MQALKQATDTLNSAANGQNTKDGKARPTGRGRRYGSNVYRIKNMFMQMETTPGKDDQDPDQDPDQDQDQDPSRISDQVRLSIPRASSLTDNMDHGALGFKVGSAVTDRVSRFDGKADGSTPLGAPAGYSKLQEMRKIFEQRTQQEKQAATNRILLKKERASGFQDGRLDVVVRFNGSTESLDSLEPTTAGGPTEAVSPTVSQLSAVFEKAEIRNNVHRPASTSASPLSSRGVSPIPSKPPPPPPPSSKIAAKKVRILPPQDVQQEEGGPPGKGQEAAPGSPRNKARTQAERVSLKGPQMGDKAPTTHSFAKTELHRDAQDRPAQEVGARAAEPEKLAKSEEDAETVEAGSRLVQAEVHASLENGEALGGPQVRVTEDGAERPGTGLMGEEDEIEEESRKEDYSEGDLVDISAYSGVGDDSGGSQLDEDEEVDEDEPYEPESSSSEIPGLPAEDEAPANRKICFSVGPITVSLHTSCIYYSVVSCTSNKRRVRNSQCSSIRFYVFYLGGDICGSGYYCRLSLLLTVKGI